MPLQIWYRLVPYRNKKQRRNGETVTHPLIQHTNFQIFQKTYDLGEQFTYTAAHETTREREGEKGEKREAADLLPICNIIYQCYL